MHESLKIQLAQVMIGLSVVSFLGMDVGVRLSFFLLFPTLFGPIFGLLFIILQLAYCFYFDLKKGIWIVIGGLGFALMGYWLFGVVKLPYWRYYPPLFSNPNVILPGGACIGGFLLGTLVVRGKL